MRGWKILGVSIGLMILSPLMVVNVLAEPCPVPNEDQLVVVTYKIGDKGIIFELTPWVVDICHNKEIEWGFDGPLGGDVQVAIDGEHQGPNEPDPWKKNGKGKKKVKLGKFQHRGSVDNEGEEAVEEGTYKVILTIGGVGEITIDPGYRVWP